MPGIFISYRREDTSGYSGRLAADLNQRFEQNLIFHDIDQIDPGADFVEAIQEALDKCQIMLAVIGPAWVGATDKKGRRRVENPHDFVVLEIQVALQRKIRVIPVLVGGAEMPDAEQLPDQLKQLARRQAHELSDTRWRYDLDRLVEEINLTIGAPQDCLSGTANVRKESGRFSRGPAQQGGSKSSSQADGSKEGNRLQGGAQREQPTPGERQISPPTGWIRWLSWSGVGLIVVMLVIGVLWYFRPPGTQGILVPAGTFRMGCDVQTDGECEDDEKPGVEIYVSAFSIDRYEVTVTEYRRCLEAGGCSTDGLTEYKGCNWGKTGQDNHPINCVNWYQADDYCRWAGKRLPTEAELEKAARGEDKRKYPWGNVWDGKKANTPETKIGTTVPVNSYSSGASPYGVYNMIGNVAEWAQDWYDEGTYARRVTNQDPRGPDSGYERVVRGGSWQSSIQPRTSDRDKANPAYRHASVGFRCVW